MIQETLNQIEQQIGLTLNPCTSFPGIHCLNGASYFNVEIPERVSESLQFMQLLSYSDKYRTIRVEPNGLNRIAIFPA